MPDKLPYSHIIITRFSCRSFEKTPPWFDPLDPAVLSRRFDLFEATCLASILGQTCKDFSWVLIVDEALPEAFRSRLEDLVSQHANAYLQCYSEDLRLRTLDWLVPYAVDRQDSIVSTLLDDDDMLSGDFVERIRAHLNSSRARDGLPRFLLMACRNALQWDLVAKRHAPLGHLKPWHPRTPDGRYYPPSTGYSALSGYPNPNLSIFRFGHYVARFYFADRETVAAQSSFVQERVGEVRTELARHGVLTHADVVPGGEGLLHWIPGDSPPAVVVNHGANIQMLRLFFNARRRIKVEGPASLAGFPLDLAAVERYLERNPPRWSYRMAQLRHIAWLKFSTSSRTSLTRKLWRAIAKRARRLGAP